MKGRVNDSHMTILPGFSGDVIMFARERFQSELSIYAIVDEVDLKCYLSGTA